MSGWFLLLSLIEVLSDVRRQQAADTVVRKDQVEVPQKPTLGFEWLVLRLQYFEGYNLQI